MKYLFRLQYGYDWFNLESKSRSKCPSINCTTFTSQEDLEIEISPIVVHCRSTPPPFLLMVIVLMVIDYPLWLGHQTLVCLVLIVSYTRACETSAGCLRSIYPSLGMRQLFGDVTIGQWRHNYPTQSTIWVNRDFWAYEHTQQRIPDSKMS